MTIDVSMMGLFALPLSRTLVTAEHVGWGGRGIALLTSPSLVVCATNTRPFNIPNLRPWSLATSRTVRSMEYLRPSISIIELPRTIPSLQTNRQLDRLEIPFNSVQIAFPTLGSWMTWLSILFLLVSVSFVRKKTKSGKRRTKYPTEPTALITLAHRFDAHILS